MSLKQCQRACSFALIAATATACSDKPKKTAYEDYAGVAYPTERLTFDPSERRLGYVPNRGSDTVSVLDLDEMKLLGTVPVGRDPVDIDGPRHVVLDRDADLAYVVLSYPYSSVGAHEAAQGVPARSGYIEALHLADLSVAGDVRLDPYTSELAFASDNGMLAATHYDSLRATLNMGDARLSNLVLIEPASSIESKSAKPRRIPVCAVPAALGFNANGSRVFVACTGDDALAVVDTDSGEVLSRVTVGSEVANQPYALVTDGGRERVLVSNRVSRAVSIFDMADTPNLVGTLLVAGVPMFGAWIPDTTIAIPHTGPNGVATFDAETGELTLDVTYTNEECQDPAELSVTSDGRVMLVCSGTQYTPGSVVELDPETLSVIASVEVGIYPERMAISEP